MEFVVNVLARVIALQIARLKAPNQMKKL